jgi:hypothetical protein
MCIGRCSTTTCLVMHLQEIPLVLSAQAYKSAATHILCEMPGILDMDGDSGIVGRLCRHLLVSEPHQNEKADEGICMDLRGTSK